MGRRKRFFNSLKYRDRRAKSRVSFRRLLSHAHAVRSMNMVIVPLVPCILSWILEWKAGDAAIRVLFEGHPVIAVISAAIVLAWLFSRRVNNSRFFR
jgi:hypothetical protein